MKTHSAQDRHESHGKYDFLSAEQPMLKGETTMHKSNDDRVLGRAGARELTAAEAAAVSGGQVHTNVCTIGSHGQPDGDGHCHP